MTALLAAKIAALMLAVTYSVPVIIGGGIHGKGVKTPQTVLFAAGVVTFVALQWLI